jgi:hypothetical protein
MPVKRSLTAIVIGLPISLALVACLLIRVRGWNARGVSYAIGGFPFVLQALLLLGALAGALTFGAAVLRLIRGSEVGHQMDMALVLCSPFGLDTFWSPRMGLRKVVGDGRVQAEVGWTSHLFG